MGARTEPAGCLGNAGLFTPIQGNPGLYWKTPTQNGPVIGGRANCSALNPFMGILFLFSSSILISPGIEKAGQVKDDGSDVLIQPKIGHATYFLHELTLPLD